MYFITEPGFCQHFFENIFGFLEKDRLFIYFSFIFPASALLCEGLGDADAGGRGGKTALTGLPEVGGEAPGDFHARRASGSRTTGKMPFAALFLLFIIPLLPHLCYNNFTNV